MISLAHKMIGEQLSEALKQGPRQFRMDAPVATAFAQRELEFVKSRTSDVQKVALKARTLIPVSHEAHPGAETIVVEAWDMLGEAEITDSYANDSPSVEAEKTRNPERVYGLRGHYYYTVQDLRAIAMAGSRLNIKRAMQARRSIEAALEKVAVKGSSALGKTGLANNSLVNTFGTSLDWDFSTPSKDVYRALNAVVAAAKQQQGDIESGMEVDTLLMPVGHYQIASQLPYSDVQDKSVLKAFLENQPYIKNVAQWNQLDQMGTGSTPSAPIGRMVCYKRDPAVLELEIPQDYEEFPPEIRGMKYTVECHLRTAGTVIHYPLLVFYADGATDLSIVS